MSKQKVTIREASAKTASLADGGARVRHYQVVAVDIDKGEVRTLAAILTAAATKADEGRAREIRAATKACGGVYLRKSAAVVAASAASAWLEDSYLDRRLDLAAARAVEDEFAAAAEKKREERRAARLAAMTAEERAAVEKRAAVRAIRERAAAEIAALG